MLMTCNFHTSFLHDVIQELVVFAAPTLKDLLNDMVAVDVFAQILYLVLQKVTDQLVVYFFTYNLNDLLYRSGAMGVCAELNWIK